MRLILFTLLIVSARSSLLDGAFGDGKFLSHPTLIQNPPCETAGEYNKLELDGSGGIKNHDGSQYVVNCVACDKAAFLTPDSGGAGYGHIISGLTGASEVFNRAECCYNSEHAVCIEQMREYMRGCTTTGTYEASTNDAGHGPLSTCASA